MNAPSRRKQLYAAACLEGVAIQARIDGKYDDCADLYQVAAYLRSGGKGHPPMEGWTGPGAAPTLNQDQGVR